MKIILLFISAFFAPVFWTPAQAQSKLDDHEIAAIISAAHAIDIESGKLAQFKSSNTEIEFFAQRMVTDHSTAHESLTKLIMRLGITPRENAVSQGLKSSAEKNIVKLTPLRGDEFDKEYIDYEILFHENLLKIIDNELIHNVKDEQLKSSLVKARPLFFHTFEQALRMQGFLNKEQPQQQQHCCAH